MSESATAKIAIVVGCGAVILGLCTLKARYAAPTPVPTVATAVTTPTPTTGATTVPVPTATETPAPAPAPTTQAPTADRAALLDAATAGDLARVETLSGKGVSLDGTLENAARSGNASLVAWLLGHGVAATEGEELSVPPVLLADDHDDVTAVLLGKGAHEPTLSRAVSAGAAKAVVRILGKGANANSKSTEGEPVLLTAVRDTAGAKRRIIMDALLKAGADASAKYDDDTVLDLAVSNAAHPPASADGEKAGDRPLDVVTRLVTHHARVMGTALVTALAADDDHRAPLLDALLAGSLERTATADAVWVAANNHDAVSVKKLTAKTVAWSAFDPRGTSPLQTAIAASDVPVVRALLDGGAPVDGGGDQGYSGLLESVAAAAGDSDDAVRVVRLLLEHGANPNKRNHDGRTALFAAAQQGSETVVALLLSKGARVDDPVDGLTPYETADAHSYDAVTKILKARGAKTKLPAR